eukprot:Ihof_evm4s169 gene=Ihof_evmTU4s169
MAEAIELTPKRRALTPKKSKPQSREYTEESDKIHQVSQRRRSALAALVSNTPNKQFYATNFTQRPDVTLSPSKEQTLDRAENLTEMYSKAVGLCMKRKNQQPSVQSLQLTRLIPQKINSQNAWNLTMIDYLNQFADSPVDGETNFQRASVALETGAKIYSVRVDDVHTHVYRMLAGLNRADMQDEENDENNNGEGKKRARKMHAGRTIEKKPGALDLDSLDIAPETNHLLRQTSAKPDESGAASLLLSRLPIMIGCQLSFDGMAVANPVDDVLPTQSMARQPFDMASYRADCMPTKAQLQNPSICHATEDHGFGTATQAPLAVAPAPVAEYDEALWETAAASKVTDWCVPETSFDDGGDLDEGICDTPHTPNETQPKDVVSVVACSEGGQYSYLPAQRAADWAGPMHWKPKAALHSGAGAKEGSKVRVSKTKYRLDFTEPLDVNWSRELAVAKTGLTLAKSTMEAQGESRTTLPEDLRYGESRLHTLLTRPDLLVEYQQDSVDEDRVLGPEMDTYDYNNARDADYVAPEADDDDDNASVYEPIGPADTTEINL